MTKDRLNELQQLMQNNSANAITVDVDNTHDGESGAKHESKDLRKTFERAEVVGQWIANLEKNTEDVRIYLKRVNDLKYRQKDVDDKIQTLFQNSTSIAHQISAKIKEIEAEIGQIGVNSTEARIKNIQFNTLKTRYQEALLSNNQELESYRSIQKQAIQAQLKAKGNVNVTDEELTALIDEGKDIQIFTENILADTAEAKRILADVEERHQQLLKIERMLTEIRDLFVQMSILIDSQQELVDRVEYQAQNASEYVGAVDLGKVRRSKKRYLKRKIYCGVAVLIVILLLLVILIKA